MIWSHANESNNKKESECDYELLWGSLDAQENSHLKEEMKGKVVRFDWCDP